MHPILDRAQERHYAAPMKTGGSRWLNFVTSLIAALFCCPITLMAIEPKPAMAELQIGNRTLKPVEVITNGRTTHFAGTNRFSVSGSAVQSAGIGTNAPWTALSDDGASLEWMAATTNTAYFRGDKASERRYTEYDFPPRIRQLDLKTGKWLPDLAIPIPSGPFKPRSVLEVLTDRDNRVVVLIGLIKRNTLHLENTLIEGYSLAVFNERDNKPLWTREFASEGARPYTGGFLWGVPPPKYAGSQIRQLNWLGERLLVCPEAMQPLYCINPDTGTELWHVERLWEFQRGFIGPSVWAHFIGRLGIWEYDFNRTNLVEAQKAFDDQFKCALAGGPAVVPLHFERDENAHSIFITTVKGPAKEWAGYLSDCVVYELGDDGKPVSMGTLPQMADGSEYSIHDDDVIWKCQHDTFVRLSPARKPPTPGMFGEGNTDGLFNLVWTRRVQYDPPRAFLLTGKNGDPAAFGESWAFCNPGGAYVLREEDKQFHFPLAAVNLSSGEDASMVLNVPFEGKLLLPDTNIRSEGGPHGYHTTVNPLEMALTYLEAYGHRLDVMIATESAKWTLSFDVGEALAATTKTPATNASNSKIIELQYHLRTQKDRDEALQEFARGTDIETVKMLVKIGANPKYASDLGWTALMVAAAYGNAETVDALIGAGSDVNAADNNCGGQTVLIWAARSGKDAKQKVRALLKAGANLNAATTNGWNALMAAANWGDLEMVEYLLGAGMSASNRDHDGDTALMAASSGGAKPSVLSALIKAGAVVNATNNNGMTALMQAAKSPDATENAKVLLKAGADPNLKNKNGQTALALAIQAQSQTIGVNDGLTNLLKSVTKVDTSAIR
jgi:ankyrin repeat protein